MYVHRATVDHVSSGVSGYRSDLRPAVLPLAAPGAGGALAAVAVVDSIAPSPDLQALAEPPRPFSGASE